MEKKKLKNKMRIKKGDTVVVLSGKYKGIKGKVLRAFPKTEKLIVEKVNFIKRHTKPTQQNPQGGIVKKEAPIHISNLLNIDPASGKPTRVGRKLNDKNKLVRFAKKSGEEIK